MRKLIERIKKNASNTNPAGIDNFDSLVIHLSLGRQPNGIAIFIYKLNSMLLYGRLHKPNQ